MSFFDTTFIKKASPSKSNSYTKPQKIMKDLFGNQLNSLYLYTIDTNNMNSENLKTVKTVAHQYNYSQVYLYRIIKKGTLKVINIDGVMFIDISNLPADFGKKK